LGWTGNLVSVTRDSRPSEGAKGAPLVPGKRSNRSYLHHVLEENDSYRSVRESIEGRVGLGKSIQKRIGGPARSFGGLVEGLRTSPKVGENLPSNLAER